MLFSFSLKSEIDLVAVYAAAVSTIVFIWQVFVWWKSGVQISVRVSIDMLIIGGDEDDEDKKFIMINAANVGSSPTTITNVLLFGFDSWEEFYFLKPSYAAVVNHTSAAQPLPCFLAAGQQFLSRALQNENIDDLMQTKLMAMGVATSTLKKPVFARLTPRKLDIPIPILRKGHPALVIFWIIVGLVASIINLVV